MSLTEDVVKETARLSMGVLPDTEIPNLSLKEQAIISVLSHEITELRDEIQLLNERINRFARGVL